MRPSTKEALEAFRARLGCDAVLLLCLQQKGPPILIEESIQGSIHTKASSAPAQVLLSWDSQVFRKMMAMGLKVANPNSTPSALVRFPSTLFAGLPCEGIREVVMTSLVPWPNQVEWSSQPVIALVHFAGTKGDDRAPSFKTYDERLAYAVGIAVWQPLVDWLAKWWSLSGTGHITQLDNESKELILIGCVFTIAGEAGHICRLFTNSDHGIDAEIEFKDKAEKPTGVRLYLQLKSGDSYLYRRKRDSSEVFSIKNPYHAVYWKKQAYPVMLVIRTSDGSIRWMDVTSYLKKKGEGQEEPIKQIVFKGEPLTPQSLQDLGKKLIPPSTSISG